VESHRATPASALPAPPAIEVRSDAGGPARAVVSGQIDRAAVPTIRSRLADVRQRFGSQDTIIDLCGVDFIDSSGLHILLQTHQQLERDGAVLVLVAPGAAVRSVLSLTGLDRHLTVVDTLPQATALLAAERDPRDRRSPAL
jgi:anti-sigma B factor antagonist